MKPLKYLAVAVLVTAPLMVESTHVVHAADGRLVSAGSVTLSGLAAAGGVDGIQNPETHAPEGDEGEGQRTHEPGQAPHVKGNDVAAAGAEIGLTFDGLNHRDNRLANGGNQFSSEPPDQALCVGPDHVLEGVNTVLRVYDKAGSSGVARDLVQRVLRLPAGDQPDDRRVRSLHDRPGVPLRPDSGRFFMAVLTLDQDPDNGQFTGKNRLDIAVSETSDPTGKWNLLQAGRAERRHRGNPDHHCDPEVTPPEGMTNPAACIGDFPHIGTDQLRGLHHHQRVLVLR